MRVFIILFFALCSLYVVNAQYSMSNQIVSDCEGTLTDSELNILEPGWYSHDENFNFTICPSNALSIIINFTSFLTEPINDYVIIYDGPDNTYPILAGPFSGTSLPPQIVSSGCVTIQFVSDLNVAEEGFELSWETIISTPQSPTISLLNQPSCSTTTLNIQLSESMHCDSVSTSNIFVGGQINQSVNAFPLNCVNDSTNDIQLNIIPGLNESGLYNIYLQSYFLDDCDSLWDLSANMQFVVNDCPLEISLNADDYNICEGECTDIYVNVCGGDSTSYNYTWSPFWMNNPGPQTVCPVSTTQYIVIVDDNGPASPASDTITVNVFPPPVTQNPISICENSSPINLFANPIGGVWSGSGIIDPNNGLFSPYNLSGVNTVTYTLANCSDDLDITIEEVNAGDDISVCVNTSTFNLNSINTTPGGVWSGCPCIQSNGDITVGNVPLIISAIYTLPNGCSDTLLVTVVDEITMPSQVSLCQRSGNYPLSFSPANGVWSVLPDNPQLPSVCANPIINFPHFEGWETNTLNGWTSPVNNDFDWITSSGSTPSGGTGPSIALEGSYYAYAEASSPNYPSKRASLVSPCINLSAYNNPVLYFWHHQYGSSQGSLYVDISIDNGLTWNWNVWSAHGDMGNQWNESYVDLSSYNSSEVLIRFRVITGDDYSSDIALDNVFLLAGPISVDGNVITDAAIPGTHNLTYSIEGCSDFVDIIINEINSGDDQISCPSQSPFNLSGAPLGGVWSGSGIINNSSGLFDPSINLGLNIVTYSFNGCVDTAQIWVVDTDVQIDSLFLCLNSGNEVLNMGTVPRVPWNGVWSGVGVINGGPPGEFSPVTSGPGIHTINYDANGCDDDLIVKVFPKSILLDTLICSNSTDIILNVLPEGGVWNGNGIVNSVTGLFSPSQLGVGDHYITYLSQNNCLDTFKVTIYDPPTLSINNLDNTYCFVDSNIYVNALPLGGVLSGNGVSSNVFNPSLAGSGYHTVTYTYGSGNCEQSIDHIVFVEDQLSSNIYTSNDTICYGDLVVIGVNASGGVGNYIFVWNNDLSSSFEHLINPEISNEYIVSVSDGCSQESIDTVFIFVHPTFDINFITSQKLCYGDYGFARLDIAPQGSYSYLWNTNPIITSDSIYDLANRNYQIEVIDNNTNCTLTDTVTIPGYKNISASFFANKNECVSILDGNIQFINNSIINQNELSETLSYWDFGDGSSVPFQFGVNPEYSYIDTGIFSVKLILVNKGGCMDSSEIDVCIISENKVFAPNIFTPDGDNCNDEFYLTGLGYFTDFNIKIYNRWGGDVLFESSEKVWTDIYSDLNNCNDVNSYQEYYKMGSWDGRLDDGSEAALGVYVFLSTYKSGGKNYVVKGPIILMR